MNRRIKQICIAMIGFDAPGGRTHEYGPQSGEKFREKHLRPALKSHEHVVLLIDGSTGGTSSFHDEAIGGLIRDKTLTAEEAKSRIEIKTSNPELGYIADLVRRVIEAA